ncbi:MAG: MucB/RseB C-terminal domain-containing protein [Succinivibrionaceae bacterium]|nr:MucB/RseB C-terminal domain-containing protein [Succinivibrionaceae bacterium]
MELSSAILQHMSVSHKHYLYDNYLIEATVSNINPMKISHGIFDEDSILFVSNLNGLPQGMLSYKKQLVYLEANSNVYAVKNVKFPNLYLRLINLDADEILKRYVPLVSGQSRIAGKLVQVIKLIPKNRMGYSLILGVDQNSGLLLQLDVVDKQGKLLKSYMSVHMEILENNPLFLQDLMTSLPDELKTVKVVEQSKDNLEWKLKNVPTDFDVMATNKHAIRNNSENAEYMLISDGLTDVSIYITSHKSDIRVPLSSINGTTVYRQRISDKFDVSVVGIIPPNLAKQIADNIEFIK